MVDRGLFDKKYHIALLGNQVVPIQNPNYIQRQVLGPHFQPSSWDVICHNAKEYQDHVGNKRFKLCIENHLSSYMKASSRIAKSAIITNLVNSIRDSSTQPGGGFVRFDESSGLWYEVGEKIARDKVGQALREAARLQQEKRTPKGASIDADPLYRAKPKSSVVSEKMSMGMNKSIHKDTSIPSPYKTTSTPTGASSIRLFQVEHNTMSAIMPARPEKTTSNKVTTDETGTSEEQGDLSSDQLGSLDSGRLLVSSSSSGIETAGELLEWFENDI